MRPEPATGWAQVADSAPVAVLFREHHGDLVRLALLMVGDLATAEDVVQDVYARLHARSARIDAVLPYVRAAVLNGCRTVLRRRAIARRVGAAHREEPPAKSAEQTWGNLAVSPDGSKLAFTVDSSSHVGNQSPGYSDEIIVIDLRTGANEVWTGGLYRSGKQFSIRDLSWTADGRSLVFLGQWCDAIAAAGCDGTSAPGSTATPRSGRSASRPAAAR